MGWQMVPAPDIIGTLLATIFNKKSKKWHPKRHPKFEAEKVSKMYAKRVPK